MTATKTNAQTFDYIYKTNRWVFGSGTGSIAYFNQPFINFVNNFIDQHSNINTILDIGCGDWQIGQHLNLGGKKYIGTDVSPVILNKTKTKFESPAKHFIHLDATKEDLPDADLVIVKDVLQHLSNTDISSILSKLTRYRYVIIQNDIYPNQQSNSNILNGQFRPLDITKEPFNAKEYNLVLEYTEGLRKLPNIMRQLFLLPPIKKGIFSL